MTRSKLTIDQRDVGDVTILKLAGQLILDDGDLVFRKQIHDLVDRGRFNVVVDLGDVDYIDSAGVGMIVGKLNTLRKHGGDMKLLHVNKRGLRIFGIAKLLLVFETFDDEDAAVKSFEFKVR